MRCLGCLEIVKNILWKTVIIHEFTFVPPKFVYIIFLILNQMQILKYVVFYNNEQLSNQGLFYQFTLFLIRPHQYFVEMQKTSLYSMIAFIFIQSVFLVWIALMFKDTSKQEKTNYVITIEQQQQKSSFHYIAITLFKISLICLSDFLSLQLIEGGFMILLKNSTSIDFSYVSSIFVIFYSLLAIICYETFLSLSLSYIPIQLNQQIQETTFTVIIKGIQIAQAILFSSNTITQKVEVLIFMSLGLSLLQFYIYTVIQIKLDYDICNVMVLCQCIIFLSSVEQLIKLFLQFNMAPSLWILLVLPMYKIIQFSTGSNFNMDNHQWEFNGHLKTQYIIQKQKLVLYDQANFSNLSYQNLILSQILRQQHYKRCKKLSCNCKQRELSLDELEVYNVEHFINQNLEKLKGNQLCHSYFYVNHIQLLIYKKNYFEALNICSKILSSNSKKSSLYSKSSYILKEQLSFKNMIYVSYYNSLIQVSIQSSLQQKVNQSDVSVKQAIKSLEHKFESQAVIQEKFEKIIKTKSDFLIQMTIQRQYDDSVLESKTLDAITQLLQYKLSLENNYREQPTQRNYSLLLFLQVEVLNDLINSQNMQASNTSQGEIDQIYSTTLIYQKLQTEFSFITFSFKDEDNINIEQITLNQKFSLNYNNYASFSSMIPESIQGIHKVYIRNFFMNGQNRYFQNVDISFLQVTNNIILPIEMCMDLSYNSQSSQLISMTFIKEIHDQAYYIFLDQNLRIKEISSDFYYLLLNFPQTTKMVLKDQDIIQYIPDFNNIQQLIENTASEYSMQFPCYQPFLIDKSQSCYGQKKFNGRIKVIPRTLENQISYYIVEISYLTIEFEDGLDTIVLPQVQIDEKEIINIPLDFGSENENHRQMHVSSRFDSQKPLLYSNVLEGIDLIPNNLSISSNIVRIQEDKYNDVQNQMDDAGSHVSSVAAIKNSLYYKQFFTINNLIFSKRFPLNIRSFNILYTIYIIIVILHAALLVLEVLKLHLYLDYISLLSVKYSIYEPILSFLNTRYTILDLTIALSTSVIEQEQFIDYVAFPRSNLVSGYDDLKVSVFDVLTRTEFQPFLQDEYFTSYWYEQTTNFTQKNLSVREGILALLNYQYDFKLAYTIKPLNSDSPYFYFSYENYFALYDYFSTLNDQMLVLINNTINQQQSRLFYISAPLIAVAMLISIWYAIYLGKQRKLKNLILSLLHHSSNEVILTEVQRLKQLQIKINQNKNLINHYNLDLYEIDQLLKKSEIQFKKLTERQVGKYQQSINKKKILSLYSLPLFVILLLNIIIYIILVILTIETLKQYLDRYGNTSKIYQELSNTGVDVLIIYAQREVLYRRAFIPFYGQSEISKVEAQIVKSLSSIKQFNSDILHINSQDYLFDTNSMQLFVEVNHESLCSFLPEDFSSQSIANEICPSVLQGVLVKGLQATLNYMYTSVYSEGQVNNYLSRSTNAIPVRELEGATLTAKVIKVLVSTLFSNLNSYTASIKENFSILFVLFICIDTIFSIFIIVKFTQFEYRQINNLRKIVYLLPQSTLLFDDHFQRQIKQLIQQGLI